KETEQRRKGKAARADRRQGAGSCDEQMGSSYQPQAEQIDEPSLRDGLVEPLQAMAPPFARPRPEPDARDEEQGLAAQHRASHDDSHPGPPSQQRPRSERD